MKKKITYILSLLMIVCMLGACGSDNAEKTYGGYTTDELHTEATDSLSNIQNYIALVDSCGGYDSYEKSVKGVEEKTCSGINLSVSFFCKNICQRPLG